MDLKKITIALLALGIFACTNLEEELREDLTGDQARELLLASADVSSLLEAAYNGLQAPFQDQAQFWAAQEHTSDEVIGPTRGPDWDDNGVWRVLHNHTWDADHAFLGDTFNNLLGIVFNTTNILNFNPSPSQAAEARFLRAFAMFAVLDGWNQVPFRDPGEDLLQAPRVLTGAEAAEFIASELNAILPDLPDGPATRANKDAARVLLMKAFLNKGTFADRANPKFEQADMNQVISLADAIIGTGNYSLEANFFDNFNPTNGQNSSELIFVDENKAGIAGGSGNNIRSRWFCGLHYNQNPSGWNGFTTIADFYDKFDAADPRIGGEYAGMTDVSGLRTGFLIGQQFDAAGNALEDRKGNPLAFTREVKIIETGNNLEITGIRVNKYPIDYDNGDNVDNDAVIYRYSDVLLMKAEALLRNGDEPAARAIVNDLRSVRGVPALGTLTLDNLLDERGFELYWESHRRQDLIRFGKFLDAWNEKPASGPERLIFPIPNQALAVNPNLEQNPGYN
ncbi:MAG: RagB/SusD family nutrient uptake outer membrane protein [Phaeodactylibacter sp.]|nr:RagB/SusD family nutrient uptake outer membrane protein [Phaeodactylibacter sp.]